MWEDNAALSILKESCWPAIDGLEEAPGPDEGYIFAVEMDYARSTARDHDKRACQTCGEPVFIGEPHVRATVKLRVGKFLHHKNPVFCDRECWASWASREGDDGETA